MISIPAFFDAMRAPEYTGQNRCYPCTIGNAIIGCAIAAIAWILGSPAGAVVVLACSGLAIYLRGYLIPGTPALTQRYLPTWLARRAKGRDSGHRGLRTNGGNPSPAPDEIDDGEDELTIGPAGPQGFLLEQGVIQDDRETDDVVLHDTVREGWYGRIPAFISSESAVRAQLMEILGIEEGLDLQQPGDAVIVSMEGETVGSWVSPAALAIDMAADAFLAEWIDGWSSLGPENRSDVAFALRGFLERCPTCDQDVTTERIGADSSDSCCGGPEMYVGRCEACETVFFEVEVMPTPGPRSPGRR